MNTQPYDVWYDPNEIDETNHAQVLRAWARPNLEITFGKIVLLGDDEQDLVPARISASTKRPTSSRSKFCSTNSTQSAPRFAPPP